MLKLRKEIAARLENVPKAWVQRYKEKLRDHDLGPRANVQRIDNLEELRQRRDLLPPPITYQHKTGVSPTDPEHRAISCKLMTGYTRDGVKEYCENDHIFQAEMGGNETPIKRFSPHNIHAFEVNGKHKCISRALLKTFDKNPNSVIANDFQRDVRGDNWPEMHIQAWKPVLLPRPFRVPFHVAAQCGTKLRLPTKSDRKEYS